MGPLPPARVPEMSTLASILPLTMLLKGLHMVSACSIHSGESLQFQ